MADISQERYNSNRRRRYRADAAYRARVIAQVQARWERVRQNPLERKIRAVVSRIYWRRQQLARLADETKRREKNLLRLLRLKAVLVAQRRGKHGEAANRAPADC